MISTSVILAGVTGAAGRRSLLLISQTVPIADKLLLTLPEAQALTGLSREFLREAISNGTLKAAVIGRSWRIKRSDLEEYVAGLF
ncbi:MAG: helix-turn-helix domain-containing protein [Rhizonema sp. NSF051]|nr:helix-turn-helix domain-containing protein [Rhizonema sp. NSF051]